MLSHLIYISKRSPSCTDEELDAILRASQKNNKQRSITGVLLYTKNQFLQYMEGEYKDINALYDKIKQDPRHANTVLIGSSRIAERTFPSWQMGAKNLDKINLMSTINEEERKVFQNLIEGNSNDVNVALKLINKILK